MASVYIRRKVGSIEKYNAYRFQLKCDGTW
jgi:hypothetical protein